MFAVYFFIEREIFRSSEAPWAPREYLEKTHFPIVRFIVPIRLYQSCLGAFPGHVHVFLKNLGYGGAQIKSPRASMIRSPHVCLVWYLSKIEGRLALNPPSPKNKEKCKIWNRVCVFRKKTSTRNFRYFSNFLGFFVRNFADVFFRNTICPLFLGVGGTRTSPPLALVKQTRKIRKQNRA